MDEPHQEVKSLLTRAADAASAFVAPPVETLTQRRPRGLRSRPVLAAAAAAAAVLALTVGLSTTGAHYNATTTTTSPATTPPTLSLPGPTGPVVSIPALNGYRWSALPTAPISERGGAASVWTGQVLIVWGGQTSDDQLRTDGATYDPTSRTWTTLPAAPLSGRTNALSAWSDNSFIVWGGDDDSNGHHAADGARYDPRTATWTKLPGAPISSYDWAQLVVAGDQAVLLSTPEANQGEVHADAYDPTANTWRPMSDFNAPTGHQILYATALAVGDTVFVWSDWFHSTHPSTSSTSIDSGVDTYALDTRTAVWSPVPLRPDQGRDAAQPIWTGKQVLLPDEDIYCGPCSHPASLDNPGVAIDPLTGTRTPIPTGPLSTGFVDYFWTGSALLALDAGTEVSGPNQSMHPGDVAAWDPETNNWTKLSSTSIYGGATGAVTVWTGTRLLIWGISTPPGNSRQVTAGLQFAPPGS